MQDLVDAFNQFLVAGLPLTAWLALGGIVAFAASTRWNWWGALVSVVGGIALIFAIGIWATYKAGHPDVTPTPDGDLRPLAVILVGSYAFLSVLIGGVLLMVGAVAGLIARALWRRRRQAASSPPRSA